MERTKRRGSRLRAGVLARRSFSMGKKLNREGRFEEAIAAFEAALVIDRDYADAHNAMGIAHHELGRVDAAESAYRRALRIDPCHVRARSNLGAVFRARNMLSRAIACWKRAVRTNPTDPIPNFNLGTGLLLSGNLADGFRLYEKRWSAGEPWRGKSPLKAWRGQRSLRGKSLLLLSEQGLGDMIQFSRFIPHVLDLGAHVHLVAKRPLLRLFKASFPGIEGIHPEGGRLPRCDEYCPLASLAHALGIELSTIPARVPYLEAPKGDRHAVRGLVPGAMKVGIVWSGSSRHANDRNRSIPFMRFRRILQGCGIQFVCLQRTVGAAERAAVRSAGSLVNPMGRVRDMADTAAVIEQLDLVVTVDTSIAHLSGALGKPVWVLLPFAPDWRWMLGRADSPWYPSMRLFRQRKAGDWDAVLARVSAALQSLRTERRERVLGVDRGRP